MSFRRAEYIGRGEKISSGRASDLVAIRVQPTTRTRAERWGVVEDFYLIDRFFSLRTALVPTYPGN